MSDVDGPVDYAGIKTVSKRWGYERWIVNQEYCGKTLFFFSGMSCSFHYHKIKHETFLIQSGSFEIRYCRPYMMSNPWWDAPELEEPRHFVTFYRGAKTATLFPGDTFSVPPGLIHQMRAVGGDSSLVEFSTHHDDADSYRICQ